MADYLRVYEGGALQITGEVVDVHLMVWCAILLLVRCVQLIKARSKEDASHPPSWEQSQLWILFISIPNPSSPLSKAPIQQSYELGAVVFVLLADEKGSASCPIA